METTKSLVQNLGFEFFYGGQNFYVDILSLYDI